MARDTLTSDFTHVGAAEMLAGVSQAAYCMTANYAPELLVDDMISRCCFSAVNLTFSAMLAPETEASLMLEMDMLPSGLPRFHLSGFINGSPECGLFQAGGHQRHRAISKTTLPANELPR